MKKEEEKFLEAQEVAEDMVKIVESGGDKGEYNALLDYLENSEQAYELVKRLTTEGRASEFFNKYPQSEADAQSEKLTNRLIMLRRQKLKCRIVSVSMKLAAVVSIISFAIYGINRNESIDKNENNAVVTNTTIAVPTIITEDGQEIDLSSLDKSINLKGAVIHKLENNKFSYTAVETSEVSYVTMRVPSKYTSSLLLDDGTEVLLNANSELRYPTKFTDSSRVVTLKGEAYFKVKKSNRPFFVNIDDMYVKVYGTKFNINAYDKIVKTLLVEGVVGVGSKMMNEVKLAPDDMCIYNTVDNNCKIKEVDSSEELFWMNNVFKYTDKPLMTIIKDFEAWYGVKFINEMKKDINLSLYLKRTSSIEDVTDFIETINPSIKFIKKKGVYYIQNI